jgi:transcription elongation factor Elf1
MNRRKFFGLLVGAAVVAPKFVEACSIHRGQSLLAANCQICGESLPQWQTPPNLPPYVMEMYQRVLDGMLEGKSRLRLCKRNVFGCRRK